MKILIKTMAGLETVLAEEAKKLNLSNIQPITRGIYCEGNWAQLYKCNYLLRSAIRVLVPIAEFTIKSQEEYYEALRTIKWSHYFKNKKTTFAIGATVFSEIFTNSQFATYRCKDAIVDQLMDLNGYRPNVNLEKPHLVFQVHLSGEKLSVLIDSSGKSLHLRNYKERAYKAPLNEVMAAGIIKLSGWDGIRDFYDPMCGSGTFTTEALMIAANLPAGQFIERFSFQNWPDFHPKIWDSVKESAQAYIKSPQGNIYASDINDYAVRDLKKNLQKHKFRDMVNIRKADFLESKGHREGVVFLNPPYDKRIKMRSITDFYRNIADKLKRDWQGSEAWVISGNGQAMKNFGLKSTKKYNLDNGGISSKLYKFELYGGSKKAKYQNHRSPA